MNKLYKAGKAEPDPLRGLDETVGEGKPAVVVYEVDPDFRETERLPRLKDGRIGTYRDSLVEGWCHMDPTLAIGPAE